MKAGTNKVSNAQTSLTAKDIVKALRYLHPQRPHGEWIFFEELRIGTGYGPDAEQRLDAWAMHTWPSTGLERVAYEVKISRSDFLAEIRNPRKRRYGLLFSNRFYFAAPEGLIAVSELPVEAGLVEISTGGYYASVTVPAPWRDTPPPSWRFMASVLRRAAEESR